jgi:hypothetical protein
MLKLTPKLGDRVRIDAILIRRASGGVDDYGRGIRLKSWERVILHPDAPRSGIYVGKREKSNGSTRCNGPEEGTGYRPIAYFEVWLVAYADNRDILVCLPQDVHLESMYDKIDDGIKGGSEALP